MAKRRTRVSGCDMNRQMGYAKKTADGLWTMDVGEVDAYVKEYVAEAEETGRYSIAGMCIALGVTRETLQQWRSGYVSARDAMDTDVLPNEELATCIAMGELHIERHWEECDKSAVQSKYVKMLGRAGVFDEAEGRSTQISPPFDMGSLKKYCK